MVNTINSPLMRYQIYVPPRPRSIKAYIVKSQWSFWKYETKIFRYVRIFLTEKLSHGYEIVTGGAITMAEDHQMQIFFV